MRTFIQMSNVWLAVLLVFAVLAVTAAQPLQPQLGGAAKISCGLMAEFNSSTCYGVYWPVYDVPQAYEYEASAQATLALGIDKYFGYVCGKNGKGTGCKKDSSPSLRAVCEAKFRNYVCALTFPMCGRRSVHSAPLATLPACPSVCNEMFAACVDDFFHDARCDVPTVPHRPGVSSDINCTPSLNARLMNQALRPRLNDPKAELLAQEAIWEDVWEKSHERVVAVYPVHVLRAPPPRTSTRTSGLGTSSALPSPTSSPLDRAEILPPRPSVSPDHAAIAQRLTKSPLATPTTTVSEEELWLNDFDDARFGSNKK
eukprot:gnl/Spiro4/10998_TR5829_c0_g3_i1.p1 gnl/Spiro4/10998_TR5829_c0_g3~~gnl/Spiro4/10998_TR5829_c0_g3_i1.p1  ORF type:complete len:314 (-),score=55.81 gnl/Spiro4/10998_TR5829_c0_g3_i1:54-995(-)